MQNPEQRGLVTALMMTAQPLVDDKYDAEIAVERQSGAIDVYRKERRHSIWFVEVNFETGEMKPVKEQQFQISLSAVWWNYKMLSGLVRPR